jgi:stage V sporulation protein AD
MNTLIFDNVYLDNSAIIGSKMEKAGPLASYFDWLYDDLYCNERTFEKGEQHLVKDAFKQVFKKSKFKEKDIDIMFGGDLLNQITTSSYISRDYKIPFIGTFSACSSFTLTLGLAASYINKGYASNAIAFTSSHNGTAERQFRYPLEYGVQKKETSTYTVTGAICSILTNQKRKIKVKSFTIGSVNDGGVDDANDMGNAMVISAYETIKNHLKDLNIEPNYYDLIVTGDLSRFGKKTLIELFKRDNLTLDNYEDCGLLIYDINKQEVFAGGSGCACCGCVTMGLLKDKLEKGELSKILVVATGALLSTTSIGQKETIPSISHAISLEVSP